MNKYRITAETVIEIEASSEEEAHDIFYDEVYEVDRHGITRIELVEP
jgi:hypothetical protein